MADEALYQKSTTADRTGGQLWIQKPAATPSGFDDFQIDPDDLLSPEQARLTANESNIASNTARIITLENNSTKRLDLTKVSSFTFTQAAGSVIDEIYFLGAGTVAVGTTLAGVDIVSSRLIENGIRKGSVSVSDGYTEISRTIYITLSTASVDVATFSKLSLFT